MKPVEISQLNRYIKTVLQNDPLLSHVSVVGEVSNLKYHDSGHVYFSLKDKNSTIRCFLPSSRAETIGFFLEEGMSVVAFAYIYLYEKGGYYSLNINDIRPEGEGALAAAFEKLKKKLDAEGLFDPKYKKSLPVFPKRVGVCTADTGAAVWDIITTIKNKNNYVEIILSPCKVQGEGASSSICAAIKALENREEQPDVIIVGRGGGSIEDLWAFNEEAVARAVFNCGIPVISGVGHETDVTITDFCADYRAATPTAAAEAAVPDIREIKAGLEYLLAESRNSVEKKLFTEESYVERLSPVNLLNNIKNNLKFHEASIDALFREAAACAKSVIQRKETDIERLMSAADLLNPEHIMSLGYGAVMTADGRLVKSIDDIKQGDEIHVRVKNGTADASVIRINRKTE